MAVPFKIIEDESQKKFDTYAHIELFGHQQICGRVTEATVGGCAFIRVDVPAVEDTQPFTRYFGNGAIYSMSPISEEAAMALLKRMRPTPHFVYQLQPHKPAFSHEDDDDDNQY